MGKLERTIFKNYRDGDPIPERVKNSPELTLGLELYLSGFKALTSTRAASYSTEGPIPWLAMREYCNEYGIRGVQREDFFELVAQMDSAYLDFKAKKLQKELPP